MKTVVLAVLAFAGLVGCDVSHLVASHTEASLPAPNSYSGADSRTIDPDPKSQAQAAAAGPYAVSSQASYLTKENLASPAAEAAQTTFKGKQILLEHLREQIAEAQHLLRNEINQLHIAQVAASEAADSAEKAATHLSILSSALTSAQDAFFHAREAAKDSADEVSSQSDMVIRAKYRLRELEERLNALSLEFAASKAAAERVTASHTHKNADSIGYASHKLQESISKQGSSDSEGQLHPTKSLSVQ